MKKRRIQGRVALIAFAAFSVLIVLQKGPQIASPARPAPPLTQAPQQYPIMEAVANRIVGKYQNSTCEQLWQEKAESRNKPKSPAEQRAIQILHNDPQMRTAFINRVAAPIANKMFECGMIP